MKHMFIFIFAFLWKLSSLAQDNMALPSDFQQAAGSWKGNLTYLDYTSGKQSRIPCNLEAYTKQEGRELWFQFDYPGEKEYNGNTRYRISANGREVGDAKVISRKQDPDGTIEIILEEPGLDDRRYATIRKIFQIGSKEMRLVKLVRFEGQDQFFQRNQYTWTR